VTANVDLLSFNDLTVTGHVDVYTSSVSKIMPISDVMIVKTLI
jgi:hypothetical protein